MAQETLSTRTRRGLIICRASDPDPATFVTDYPGAGVDITLSPIPAPLDVTASGLCSESAYSDLTSNDVPGKTYVEEPLVIYQTSADLNAGANPGRLRHALELQSTGDDLFQVQIRPGLLPIPGIDDHRVESIEPFLRRATMPGTKTIDVKAVTSNILDIQGGVESTSAPIPTPDTTPVPPKGVVGTPSTAGRFVGFDLKGTNVNSIIRYMGALIRGHRIGGTSGFKVEDITGRQGR